MVEKENYLMCRALIACTIGNNYWKGGDIGVDSTSVWKWVSEAVNIANIDKVQSIILGIFQIWLEGKKVLKTESHIPILY